MSLMLATPALAQPERASDRRTDERTMRMFPQAGRGTDSRTVRITPPFTGLLMVILGVQAP